MLNALFITRLHKELTVQGKIANMLERTQVIVEKYHLMQLANSVEEIIEFFNFIPPEQWAPWFKCVKTLFERFNEFSLDQDKVQVTEQIVLGKMYASVIKSLNKFKATYKDEQFDQLLAEVEGTYK